MGKENENIFSALMEILLYSNSNRQDVKDVWKKISMIDELPESCMRLFKDRLDWKKICKHQRLSEEFVTEMSNHIVWDTLIKNQKFSKRFLDSFKSQIEASQCSKKSKQKKTLNVDYGQQFLDNTKVVDEYEIDCHAAVNYDGFKSLRDKYIYDLIKTDGKVRNVNIGLDALYDDKELCDAWFKTIVDILDIENNHDDDTLLAYKQLQKLYKIINA